MLTCLRWRRLFRESERAGVAGRFVSAVVEAAPGQDAGTATMRPPSKSVVADGVPAPGRMEIVLACARRVIVDRTVDGPALSRAIAVLEGR